ncbi:MAG: trypsin-like peptidase domain-containing protein [Bryobacterales bacterium]|nr:trypsin-like peptidase domain-containing protein [Bryobacterales bacterium]
MRLFTSAAVLVCAASLHAQTTLPALSRQFQELAERVDPAVVQVLTSGYAPTSDGSVILHAKRSTGAGVLVDPAGYILTNAHVVGEVRKVQVLLPQLVQESRSRPARLKPSGKLVPAEVIGADREADIAVLKIAGENYPFLRLADSDTLRQGQLVFAFGSPYGLENSVSMGVISSVARQVRPGDPMEYIQTDASINPGNSGGPLVDAEGLVAGINTFIVSKSGGNEGVGFAAPSNLVRLVYEQIRQHGRVRRGQVGVLPQTITPALAEALRLPSDSGVLITDVTPGGSAEAAGLRVDDIVLRAGGKAVESSRQFGALIYQSAGQTISVEVQRGARTLTLDMAVLERPKDPDRIFSLVRGDENAVPQLGILGVTLDERVTPLLPALRKLSGVVVAGNFARAPGQEDGLHPGDVIYSINGVAVRSLADLKSEAAKLRHGQNVALYLERLGQLQYVLIEAE